MNYFKSFFMRYWYYIVIVFLLTLLSITSFLLYFSYNKKCEKEKVALVSEKSTINNDEYNEISICSIDIKGAVKKPGVYEIECSKNINDALFLAGGKTKSAYTNNINLSKKVSDEMVIYVYTAKEIKTKKVNEKVETTVCKNETIYIDTCLDKNSSVVENGISNENNFDSNKREETIDSNLNKEDEKPKSISLNSATKEELMTLSGIGESKALNIISYRETNNGFKNIEELKNVSGIGDSIFEKIKDNITL